MTPNTTTKQLPRIISLVCLSACLLVWAMATTPAGEAKTGTITGTIAHSDEVKAIFAVELRRQETVQGNSPGRPLHHSRFAPGQEI